jgi:hypothetical protein
VTVRHPFNIKLAVDFHHFVEPTACNWNNVQFNISIPIYGILLRHTLLCNGSNFQFFTFDGSVERGSRFRVLERLPLVDFSSETTARVSTSPELLIPSFSSQKLSQRVLREAD